MKESKSGLGSQKTQTRRVRAGQKTWGTKDSEGRGGRKSDSRGGLSQKTEEIYQRKPSREGKKTSRGRFTHSQKGDTRLSFQEANRVRQEAAEDGEPAGGREQQRGDSRSEESCNKRISGKRGIKTQVSYRKKEERNRVVEARVARLEDAGRERPTQEGKKNQKTRAP